MAEARCGGSGARMIREEQRQEYGNDPRNAGGIRVTVKRRNSIGLAATIGTTAALSAVTRIRNCTASEWFVAPGRHLVHAIYPRRGLVWILRTGRDSLRHRRTSREGNHRGDAGSRVGI